MTSYDWQSVAAALLGSWPNQVAAWGKEAIAAYCYELAARGVTPDQALVAIRSCPAGQKFPPSAPELAALGRQDPSRPTFEEAFRLIYGPGGVLRARPAYVGGGYDGSFSDAQQRRLAQCHPLVQRFVNQQGMERLRMLEVDHEMYGDIKRRELRDAWDRLVEANEGRELAAIATGDRTAGLQQLDPLATLGIQSPRPQIEAGEAR